MKSKNKSIIASLFIVIAVLIFSTLSIVSIATPNLSKEIKKDLTEGVQSLSHGDIKNYYNMYNTRKLTEIEKTKFYEEIKEVQEIIKSEMNLFKKYKLSIKINDVSVIDKIRNNLFLCNINVSYKYRKNYDTTSTVDKTEDYIVKIIDVGNMEYKILLPFNSLDKDFSSSTIYKKLKESNDKKQAEKIQKERELKEKLELEQKENNSTTKDVTEDNASIVEDSSDIIEEDNKDTNSVDNNTSSENKENLNTENKDDEKVNGTANSNNSNNNNNDDSNKTSYESFLED